MKQEEKDLLLKDLCARLPYGVFCNMGLDYPLPLQSLFVDKLDGILLDFYEDGKDYQVYLSEVKPYLFPLSSMTEEQYHEMQTISGKDCLEHMEVEKEWRNNSSFSHLPLYEYRVIDFFIKNHFDYRGLIPMGLANDATGLNIY